MNSDGKHIIMLVDDDENLLITLTDFLELEGFGVVTASSGEEALKMLSKTVPDLIILDVNMPGMGGIGFLKRFSRLDHKIPVYVFTARSNMESFFEGLDVAGFMPKPCDPEDLLTEIRGVLGTAEGASAAAAQPSGGLKVLLAEDELTKREDMTRFLRQSGYEVISVGSGPEVVERAIVEKPDLFVLKLVMAKMNGDAVAGMLSGIPTTRSIPAVLYDESGLSPRRDVMRPEQGVGARVFCGSTDPQEVMKAIKRACARAQ